VPSDPTEIQGEAAGDAVPCVAVPPEDLVPFVHAPHVLARTDGHVGETAGKLIRDHWLSASCFVKIWERSFTPQSVAGLAIVVAAAPRDIHILVAIRSLVLVKQAKCMTDLVHHVAGFLAEPTANSTCCRPP
jgi:hypothetical protein